MVTQERYMSSPRGTEKRNTIVISRTSNDDKNDDTNAILSDTFTMKQELHMFHAMQNSFSFDPKAHKVKIAEFLSPKNNPELEIDTS